MKYRLWDFTEQLPPEKKEKIIHSTLLIIKIF